MGKGIALQFKQAFPMNTKAYVRACKAGEVAPGRMLIVETGASHGPRFIVNFPTKRHWRDPSRLDDIDAGLRTLVDEIRKLGLRSIAIPPLGCGLGGLDWDLVRPRIEAAFAALPSVRVLLYEPAGAPAAKTMPVATPRPNLTLARSLFLRLMDAYKALDYRRTLLEVQKLAYFLQEAGEPLRLDFEAAHYGPYADKLNKVLEVMEGHFIRGFGDDQKPGTEIELLPGAIEQAEKFLADKPEPRARLERTLRLIEGFETPYGMELLATVHWIAKRGGRHGEPPATDAAQALELVHAWNPRKQRVFKPHHVDLAWDHLGTQGWR